MHLCTTLIAAILLVIAVPAHAERILDYKSTLTINSDSTVDVVEKITVKAEGNRIRRGIYRDFPTDYKDRLGNRVRIGFELLSVLRDGKPEPHHSRRLSNGIRIYAGSSDVFLIHGTYEYTFHYRVTRMLGFFEQHDELYWNVTGNGWDFRIDKASAEVHLPQTVPADSIRVEGYTGRMGHTGNAYVASVSEDGVAHIRARTVLPQSHGITVVVSWPKGHVDEPTLIQDAAFLFSQNRGLLIVLGATLLSCLYLLIAWHFVGRDPAPGVIFPHYEPPEGYSPASLRYIRRMGGYDTTTMTAALLNLAVQGFVTIRRDSKDYAVSRTDKPPHDQMAPGEAALLEALFKRKKKIDLDNAYHSTFSLAKESHKKILKRYHYGRYFLRNGRFLLPAIAMLLAVPFALVIFNEFSIAIGIVFAAGAITVAIFTWLLKAPTILGRKLLDRVDGFKMFLDVAEKDDLDLRNPPEKTPELFERYLPFALALGVAQPWAEQFTAVFQKQSAESGNAYQPNWYVGRGWDSNDPVGFANVVGSSFDSAISSASTPPGSSSGSSSGGGGGSSGGGGGGGGGGGW